MTPRDFCYWLQGHFELAGKGATLTAEQVDLVQRHLSLVFKHEIDAPDPTGELQAAHDGAPVAIGGKPMTVKLKSNGRPTVYRC